MRSVHEHVQVPAQCTRFITDVSIQRELAPLELLEGGAHRVRGNGKFGCASTIPAQWTWDMQRDRRRWAHRVSRRLTRVVASVQPTQRFVPAAASEREAQMASSLNCRHVAINRV